MGALPGFDCAARLPAREHGGGEADRDATASPKAAGQGACDEPLRIADVGMVIHEVATDGRSETPTGSSRCRTVATGYSRQRRGHCMDGARPGPDFTLEAVSTGATALRAGMRRH